MAELLDALKPHLVGLVIIIIGVLGLTIKNYFSLRSKYDELALRVKTLDVDDTERTKQISAKAQEMILLTYGQQSDDIRHQRDLIDDLNSRYAVALAESLGKDQTINKLQQQQLENVEQIRLLNVQVDQLKAKADSRHEEMNKITADKAEQYAALMAVTRQRDAYKADSDLVRSLLLQTGSPVPAEVVIDNTPAVSQKEASDG